MLGDCQAALIQTMNCGPLIIFESFAFNSVGRGKDGKKVEDPPVKHSEAKSGNECIISAPNLCPHLCAMGWKMWAF